MACQTCVAVFVADLQRLSDYIAFSQVHTFIQVFFLFEGEGAVEIQTDI